VSKIVLEFLQNIFQPIFGLKPIIAIFIFSAFLTLLIILINRLLTNKNVMKDIKDRMTDIREKLSKAQKEGDKESIGKYMDEYMKINNQYMKKTFKSLIVSIVIVIIFLPVVNMQYKEVQVAVLPFTLPWIGSNLGWLGWYFLISLAISLVVRKIMGE
jgi:uncharacterized membrane protein (DUF106 family)